MSQVTKIFTTLVLAAAFNLNFYAKTNTGSNCTTADLKKSGVSETAIKNYARGIESENAGLRKSAVYMAGIYKMNALVKTLMRQFSKEKDDDIKVMIALTLYMIGDERGIAAVEGWNLK
jgi:hypothetical protein